MTRRTKTLGLFGLGLLAGAAVALAQDVTPFSKGARFETRDGGELYSQICAGCHMPNAEGAVGAARYPALANNPNLEYAAYPVTVVVQGLRAMPPVGQMIDDEQVAAVVNYIRTHFGNNYPEPATPEEAAAARGQ